MNPVPYLRGTEINHIMVGDALAAVNKYVHYPEFRPVLEMRDEVIIAIRRTELAPGTASLRDSLMDAREDI